MVNLRLSKDVELPVDVVTERVAVVGQSGSGKTYAAMRLGELMIDAGAQVIALDPMGVWWGLLSSASGAASGYPVHVFGGEHAHVPIVPEAGALVADVIVGRGISAVIDVSHFTRSEQVMFCSAFAERFYELQVKVKRPVHLFLEEAHTVLPQNLPAEGRGGDPRKNPAVMLNRMERIVRQGRSHGVGCTMVTQQPQAVNKAALNQAGTLLAMRTMGKHERKAIADWMADKATDDAQLKLDQLLPKLGTGEAWVASPHFLGLFKHTRISKKTTFDSSATPKFGVKLEPPKVLAAVDVEALRESMKSVVEEVEKDDPARLRRRIVELERELAKKPAAPPAEIPVFDAPCFEALGAIRDSFRAAEAQMKRLEERLSVFTWKSPPSVSRDMKNGVARVHEAAVQHRQVQQRDPLNVTVPSVVARVRAQIDDESGEKLGAGPAKMLEAVASKHPAPVSRKQLAALSGFSIKGGSFRTYLPRLRTLGLVDYRGADVVLTESGIARAGAAIAAGPRTTDELLTEWRAKLGAGPRKMLDQVVGVYPGTLTRAELAQRTGFELGGGSFRTYLPRLRTLGLVDYVDGQAVRASDTLFPS